MRRLSGIQHRNADPAKAVTTATRACDLFTFPFPGVAAAYFFAAILS